MTIDATFWVMISFFAFIGLLIYFKIPQKIKTTLEGNIDNIKNQIDEADKLKEDAKNILAEHEKKISNSKAEVKEMIDKARGFFNLRHKFIFNKEKQRIIANIVSKYDDIPNSIELLKELHQEFKTISLSSNYKFDNLFFPFHQTWVFVQNSHAELRELE